MSGTGCPICGSIFPLSLKREGRPLSESEPLSARTHPPRFQTLRQIPAGVPHFLAAVDLPDLMARLETLGLPRDSAVTKVDAHTRSRAAWVKTAKGAHILDGKAAASLVVRKDGRWVSLGLLAAGEGGVVAGILAGREERSLLHQGEDVLPPGMRMEMVRGLPLVRFTFQFQNGRLKHVPLCAATRVWGLSGGRRVQLAAVLVGEIFTVESFSSSRVNDRFLACGMGKGMKLRLKGIHPVDAETSHMIIEGPAHRFLISYADAGHIYVRACNICWSCGACMTAGG